LYNKMFSDDELEEACVASSSQTYSFCNNTSQEGKEKHNDNEQ